MDAIGKIKRARNRDKEVLVRQKMHKRNQFTRQLPFRTFRLQPKLALGETLMGNPVQDSLLGFIPGNATDNERQETIDKLAAAILGMTGDTTITAVSVTPYYW